MSGSFSYASFSASDVRTGGWGIGTRTGDIPDMYTAEIIPLIPTQISGATTLPTFPDQQELAQRTRRFAWLPAPWDPLETGVFLSSAAAGQDASGRSGNVFTSAFVTEKGALPTVDATLLMYSPTIPAPFGKRKVDAATAPPLQEVQPGTLLTTEVIDHFLAGHNADVETDGALPAEFGNVRSGSGPVPRAEILSFLAARITEGQQTVLLTDPAEGPLWVAALARTVPRSLPGDRTFTWSTYERAAGLSDVLDLGTSFCIVPAADRGQLQVGRTVSVVDAAADLPDPAAAGPSVTSGWETNSWGTPTSASNPFPPQSGVAEPVAPKPTPVPAERNQDPDSPRAQNPRILPDGFHPAIMRLTEKDEAFIRNATLVDWDISFNKLDPGDRKSFQPPQPVTNYLLIDPADELGHLARVRVLALISYGDDYIHRRNFHDWSLCIGTEPERDRLTDDAIEYSATHPFDRDIAQVSYSNLASEEIRQMAYTVRQRRLDILLQKSVQPQYQQPPVQQDPYAPGPHTGIPHQKQRRGGLFGRGR